MPKPPTIQGLQLLMKLGAIQRDTPGFLLECTRHYGNLVCFKAGGMDAFLINQPEMIRHILQDNAHNYTKNTIQYNQLATITGRGLLTSDGPLWLRQRRLEQPAFSRARLSTLDQVVVPAVNRMFLRWDTILNDHDILDIDREMMNLSLEIVGKELFSIDLSQDAPRLTKAVLTALDHIIYRARNPFAIPDQILTPRGWKFRKALTELDKAVYGMIQARQSLPDSGSDLLGMLLKARDEETGQKMDLEQVRDEVITLLIAGHETVASALTWAFYLLAVHPEIRKRLSDDIFTVLDDRDPCSNDLPDLKWAEMVFHETLRLYPPAWLITRQAIDNDILDGVNIPPKSLIIISPYVIHRHPQIWSNPEIFDPQRFSPESEDGHPRYAYIPFGGGPRLCIGNLFAQIEAQLIITMVSQHYRLDLIPGQHIKVDALVTLRPHGGLKMHITRR